jgi:fido (protein-threonine AMPylation protein)
VEFILIHPFREGNGRLSRLLCDVLSVLAGKGLLDYSLWDEHKAFYFKAIQAGVSGNYSPMMQLVSDLARLTGEANGFRLCLILFELLLNFLHRNTGFDRG